MRVAIEHFWRVAIHRMPSYRTDAHQEILITGVPRDGARKPTAKCELDDGKVKFCDPSDLAEDLWLGPILGDHDLRAVASTLQTPAAIQGKNGRGETGECGAGPTSSLCRG
jgi:hypothetical protein